MLDKIFDTRLSDSKSHSSTPSPQKTRLRTSEDMLRNFTGHTDELTDRGVSSSTGA